MLRCTRSPFDDTGGEPILRQVLRQLAGCLLLSALCPVVDGQRMAPLPPSIAQRSSDSSQEAELRAEIKTNPSNSDAARTLAALLERTGRTNAALILRRSIGEAQAHAADASQLQLELATALVEAGQSGEAIPILQRLTANELENQPAEFELGTAFAREEDFKAAATAFAKAVQLHPGDAQAQLSAAKALVTLLRYTDAEPYLEAAARTGQRAEIRVLRGIIYSHTARNVEAIGEFQAALEDDPSNAATQLLLGESLLQERRFNEASVSLKHAAAAHPSTAVYFHLAKAYHGLGDVLGERKAIASLHTLQESQAVDKRIEVLSSEAEHASQNGHHEEAARIYASALAVRPGDSDLLYHEALARGQAGDRDNELRLLREVLTRSPGMAAALTQVGILEGLKGETGQAKRDLRQALSLDPQRADALSNLAVIVAKEGDLAAAETMLTDAVESSPGYASAQRNLGLVYAAEGRSADAQAALQKSVALDRNDAANEIALGEFYRGQGNTTAALTALRAAAALRPDRTDLHLLLARTSLEQGDLESAFDETHRALVLSPTDPKAMALQKELCARPHPGPPGRAMCR